MGLGQEELRGLLYLEENVKALRKVIFRQLSDSSSPPQKQELCPDKPAFRGYVPDPLSPQATDGWKPSHRRTTEESDVIRGTLRQQRCTKHSLS